MCNNERLQHYHTEAGLDDFEEDDTVVFIEGPFGGHTAAPLGDWHLGWNVLRASESI